jgi:hypothetical protein
MAQNLGTENDNAGLRFRVAILLKRATKEKFIGTFSMNLKVKRLFLRSEKLENIDLGKDHSICFNPREQFRTVTHSITPTKLEVFEKQERLDATLNPK